jgi:hypothetical protein
MEVFSFSFSFSNQQVFLNSQINQYMPWVVEMCSRGLLPAEINHPSLFSNLGNTFIYT